jgi:PAS domain S-box-containing protein
MLPDNREGGSLRRRIQAIGALVIIVLMGSAVYDAWRLHMQIEITTHSALANLARALANEARRNFQSVDLLLKETVDWYQDAGHKLSAPQIEMALAARASGLSQISVLTIVDAHGQQRFRSKETGSPLADVSDRPYFALQRALPSVGLYINEPIITRTERRASLVFSRRIDAPGGRFAGVVSAIVTLEEFQEMYAALKMEEGSALLLTLRDGTLVARNPPLPDSAKGMKFPQLSALKDGPLIDRLISPLDGRAKLVAALPVGDQPLIIAMIRDEAHALAPWRDELRSAIIRTTLLALLVLATMRGLLRQLERVQAGEKALRESEERYAMTMDAANGGHAEWSASLDSTFLSDKWRSLHGLPAGQRSYTIRELTRAVHLHPDDRRALKRNIDQHFAGKVPFIEIEYRVLHPQNQWRWIHARAKSQLDSQGAPIRVFCAATDVTERQEALEAKFALERRLQQTQRLESLGTLAGGIAHDFNNILGAILGFGEMALHKAKPGSDMQRHLNQVMQAGDRARLLVRRILDFSRSGVVERAPVHIQSIIEEVVSLLQPTLAKGVTIESDLNAGDAAVIGDSTQLYQVAMNLCTNALQATDDASSVRVRLNRVDVSESRSLLHGRVSAGSYVCLEVEDTGIGIAPEILQRIFNPFFTTKRGNDGTGLGLSVVHGVVADHGGAIDVTSGLGVGTTVSVWLPTRGHCERRFSRRGPAGQEQGLGQGQTVMVVDDESSLVELAEEVLAGLGYEPVGFSTAEEALNAFRDDPDRFDAVLTDEMLPGMTGSELARLLRELRPGIPVLVMSGKITAELEQRVRAAGIDALLQKPLQSSEIADALASGLRRAAA